MVKRIPPPVMYVHGGEKATLERRDRDVTVPRSFTAQFDLERVGLVEVVVTAEDGRVRASEVRVTEWNPEGVSGVTLGAVQVADLLAAATDRIAMMGGVEHRTTYEPARRATRRRVSDERLRDVAAAYREGGIEAVKTTEHVAERQAWRLKAKAVELGYLNGDDDGER